MKEDEKGMFTFTKDKGCTIIVYAIGNEEIKGKNKKNGYKKIDSDHHQV